jgi:2,4-dienoyl-CoA reductase-like NADH-dependent reductase (Old Yellow Enzyme family)
MLPGNFCAVMPAWREKLCANGPGAMALVKGIIGGIASQKLAPLTNSQSHADGVLSDDEFRWLTYRAEGGFGLTMTCAAHVQRVGQGFPGQLGVFGDQHLPGLSRLAAEIKSFHSLAVIQLHHAGMRSPKELIGEAPHCPSDNAETDARALTLAEVEQLRDDFIAAAVRTEKAGFDGAELHGAHGYILAQFLSPEVNLRTDRYGGSLENRARLLIEIIDGVRAQTGPDFNLGLRLSPERFGLRRQLAGNRSILITSKSEASTSSRKGFTEINGLLLRLTHAACAVELSSAERMRS